MVETAIFATTFTGQQLTPLEFFGTGSYVIFNPGTDPLGTGASGVTLSNDPTASSRSSLLWKTTVGYTSVRIVADMALGTHGYEGILMVTNQAFYNTADLAFLEIEAHDPSTLRIHYLNNGVLEFADVPISIVLNVVKRLQADVTLGFGSGQIIIYVDGVEIWRISGLFNNTPEATINAVEFGIWWGSPAKTVYLYYAALSAITTTMPATFEGGPIAPARLIQILSDLGLTSTIIASIFTSLGFSVPMIIYNGQVTLAAAAAPLSATSKTIKSVTIENVSTNSVCYVGNSSVTALTGYGLRAGATISLDINDLNKVYVLGTAPNVVTYIAVN